MEPTNSPDLGGQIEIVDANFASGDLPVGLQHGNGVLTLTKDRLNITKFQGTVGGGTVTAQGGVAYRPACNLIWDWRPRECACFIRRECARPSTPISGSPAPPTTRFWAGQVNLADLSFTPAFDLNSFIDQFSGGVSAPPTPGLAQNIQLNLGVNSENNINLVSRTLSVNGSANLRVRGTAAEPVILGRVNLSGGDIILNGDRFVLNGGTIEFVNPRKRSRWSISPSTRPFSNTTSSCDSTGPIDQLRTNYSSDPSLPAADIINLLAFGTTTEASANAPSTPATQQAQSLVASQVSSQVTSRVSKVAGISQLSINPVLSGRNQPGTSRREHHHSAARHGKSVRDLFEQRSLDAEPNDPGPVSNFSQGSFERHPRSKRRLRVRHTHQENLVGVAEWRNRSRKTRFSAKPSS